MTPLLSTAFCPPIEYFAVLAGYSSVYIEACESYAKQSWRNRCRILTANGPLDFTVPIVHAAPLPSEQLLTSATATHGARSKYSVRNYPLPSEQLLTSATATHGARSKNSVRNYPLPATIRTSDAAMHKAKNLITGVRVEYDTPWVAKFRRAVESAYGNSPYYIYYADDFWQIFDERPETLWGLNAKITAFLCGKIGIAPEIVPTREFGGKGECWDLRETIHPKRKNSVMAEMGVGRPYWQVFRERFGFVGGLSVLDLLFNEGPESLSFLR